MSRQIGTGFFISLFVVTLAGWSLSASDAEMYFSYDKNGQSRVTNVQEGDEVFIVVIDNDQNTDCDVRDKMWPDVKIMDPKTGAYIIWEATEGDLTTDYLEETGADTGTFVSKRSFQIGTRESFASNEPAMATHVVDAPSSPLDDFKWGAYSFLDRSTEGTKDGTNVFGDRLWWIGAQSNSPVLFGSGFITLSDTVFTMPSDLDGSRLDVTTPDRWVVGRFENMDTLVGMYQDPNDAGDVAIAMMKIIDVEATLYWSQEIYEDANSAATLTVADADENLNCNQVEVVPVFIIVNPGSWNPVDTLADVSEQTGISPNNFCMLKRTGGIDGQTGTADPDKYRPIRWFNIYNAEKNAINGTGAKDGRYYIEYPTLDQDIAIYKSLFDTAHAGGITAVSFYAQETGVNTGVFQLNLNSILDDLGFNSLDVRDVLVAYYLDPNDEDDFKIATAYIEEKNHSYTSFTDATRADQEVYWIGRDAVYVQVNDANANVDPCCPEQVVVHICDPHGEDDGEFWILDETSSNSPLFFSNHGMVLNAVWNALGRNDAGFVGGFQLVLDNWEIEAYNEDDIYVRYNDVYYTNNSAGMPALGDVDTSTAYSGPRIDRVRVDNDLSFDLMSIGDTQVYDGTTAQMWFLNRQGSRVSGYVNSDCLFIEVSDPDQDEDPFRRERIDAYWDGGQNFPFGPQPLNWFDCNYERTELHPINPLLGDTNILNDSPDPFTGEGEAFELNEEYDGQPRIYVLNPRSGRWAATDLLETSVGSGTFVSVICIDLVHVYECVPTLAVLPGDTIVAVYQDPSNHSDSAWISIKVGVGGGGTPEAELSTTQFVDSEGNDVASYTDSSLVYVKVTDPSHAGEALLAGALEIGGAFYDLKLWYGDPTFAPAGTFITDGLDLDLIAGEDLTANYTDPTDPLDMSTDTVPIVTSELAVEGFYASPNPFAAECAFGYVGSGIASLMSVSVHDLSGHLIWSNEQSDVTEIVWDGTTGAPCKPVANGGYIYVVTATDGTNAFSGKGTVFISR